MMRIRGNNSEARQTGSGGDQATTLIRALASTALRRWNGKKREEMRKKQTRSGGGRVEELTL